MKKIVNRKPWCNNKPHTAPHFGGKCFILCWRCCGGVIGALVSIIILLCSGEKLSISINWKWALLCVPAIIDFYLNKYEILLESNLRRFITGILLGIMIAMGLWGKNLHIKLFL